MPIECPFSDRKRRPNDAEEKGFCLNTAVEEFENQLILQALQKTGGNKKEAANLLNLKRTTLIEKLKKKQLFIPSSTRS